MSILLDALRKSEKSQRPVEVPSIHHEQPSGTGGGAGFGKLTAAALMLLSFLLIAWFGWRQYQVPATGYQPPVSLPDTANRTAVEPKARSEQRDSGAEQDEYQSAVKAASNGQRTPVETYQKPVDTLEKPTAANTLADLKTSANNRDAQAVDNKPEVASRPAASRAASKSSDLQPISYWELPDSVREGVPEMKFTILVYAKEPVDRFVLINGERLHEGDSFGQGLEVKEIRREGVVFSYRLYQFLVER